MFSLIQAFILVIPGSYLLLHGIGLLKGRNKGWYFAGYPIGGGVYAEIPWGIGLFWWALAALFSTAQWSLILAYIGAIFIAFGLLTVFFPPSFLKPAWLRWLEREYGIFMPIIEQEIHEMGLQYWQDQVETQAELEEWVTKVLSKHRLIGHGRLITEQREKED